MNYQKPKGTADILPINIAKWHFLENTLRNICEKYNVNEIRTPIFEHTNLFLRAVGDTTDVVNKEMYTFNDKKGRSITLRPEGTAGIVRAVVENKLYTNSNSVNKLYYMGPMFRYERPQNGRQRQFNQFGIELFGNGSPYLDVECIAIADEILQSFKINDCKLHINTLGDKESREAYNNALKKHFSKYIDDLCPDCKKRFNKNPLRILDCKIDKNHIAIKTAPKTLDYLTSNAKEHFENVCNLLDALNIKYEIDVNLVRGLDYYNHTVFEFISSNKKLGAGSTIIGGGHYNGLVEELGGPSYPGVGFAIGMERLLLALDEHKITNNLDIFVIDITNQSKKSVFKIVNDLRNLNYSVDMDFTGKSLKSQFKIADRYNSILTIVVGDEELTNNTLNIKINATNERCIISQNNIKDFLHSIFNK